MVSVTPSATRAGNSLIGRMLTQHVWFGDRGPTFTNMLSADEALCKTKRTGSFLRRWPRHTRKRMRLPWRDASASEPQPRSRQTNLRGSQLDAAHFGEARPARRQSHPAHILNGEDRDDDYQI